MKIIVKRTSDGAYFTGFKTGAAFFGGELPEDAFRFESREAYEAALARNPHLAGDTEEVAE